MKALTISDREEMILALQDEIRRSPDARYDHRIHGVLLVAGGMSCRQVAEALGDSHGTVARCYRAFWRNSSASPYAPDNASGCFVASDFVCANPDQKLLKRTLKCRRQ